MKGAVTIFAIFGLMIAGPVYVMYSDVTAPRVGKACAVEGARICDASSTEVLYCRRWPIFGNALAWEFETNCGPGVCAQTHCAPK